MLSSGNALYDPVPVTTAQLGYYACTVEAEQYEAMLVTVSGDGVTISSTADSYGEIPIDDGSGMSAMDDHNWDVSTFLEESIGDDYANYVVTSITGTVTYSYSTFEIAPRNASDFVFAPSISCNTTSDWGVHLSARTVGQRRRRLAGRRVVRPRRGRLQT